MKPTYEEIDGKMYIVQTTLAIPEKVKKIELKGVTKEQVIESLEAEKSAKIAQIDADISSLNNLK